MTSDLSIFLHDALDRIHQTASLEEFQREFEVVKSLISSIQPWLPEAYFASRFIYGLCEDIQGYVISFRAVTVIDVVHLANIYEYSISHAYDANDVVIVNTENNMNHVDDITGKLIDEGLTNCNVFESDLQKIESIGGFVHKDTEMQRVSYGEEWNPPQNAELDRCFLTDSPEGNASVASSSGNDNESLKIISSKNQSGDKEDLLLALMGNMTCSLHVNCLLYVFQGNYSKKPSSLVNQQNISENLVVSKTLLEANLLISNDASIRSRWEIACGVEEKGKVVPSSDRACAEVGVEAPVSVFTMISQRVDTLGSVVLSTDLRMDSVSSKNVHQEDNEIPTTCSHLSNSEGIVGGCRQFYFLWEPGPWTLQWQINSIEQKHSCEKCFFFLVCSMSEFVPSLRGPAELMLIEHLLWLCAPFSCAMNQYYSVGNLSSKALHLRGSIMFFPVINRPRGQF